MWKSKLEFNPILALTINEPIIGIYRGTRKVEKINSLLHTVEMDGTLFDIYGCGSLDAQLAKEDENGVIVQATEPDIKVKILYAGKKMATVDIGGRDMKKEVHNYVVYTEENE